MNTTISPPPTSWREGRRLLAWELKQQGWQQCDIATALGVSEGAVSQWMKRAREAGVQALRHKSGSGPKPRLSIEQRTLIPTLLAKGAECYGFRGNLWTTKRVAIVIERQFGVHYHPAHVSRLLIEIGWSPQKPLQRATQRDEAAIKAWREERWPAPKKGLRRRDELSSG